MRFFEEQAKAKQKTFWLLVIFIAMVIALSFANSCVVGLSMKTWKDHFWPVFSLSAVFFVAAAWIQYVNIRNGEKIAIMMGGVPVVLPTNSPLEKRFYNIVEEMSIASGVPIPKLYVMVGESGINAFVAGINSHSVVLAVTEGALQNLTRDELQAVIGHEFSHILNEDVSLNMKIAGVVTGFYVFVRIGEVMMRGRHVNGRGRVTATWSLAGLGFVVIGSLGYLFGQILQAMVSRQREFLADASSAQFTRNPEALAIALGKIQSGVGSELQSSYKHEMSHFFFSAASTGFLARLFSTHPPIPERVKKLMPSVPVEQFLGKISAPDTGAILQQSLDDESIVVNSLAQLAAAAPMGVTRPSSHRESVYNQEAAPSEIDFWKVSSAAQAKLILFSVFVASQKPSNIAALMSQLQKDDAAQAKEVSDVLVSFLEKKKDKFNSFKSALGFLQHLSKVEQDEILQSMKSLFEMDNIIDFQEGLYFLITKSGFHPKPQIGKPVKDLRQLEDILQRWVPWILQGANKSIMEQVQKLMRTQLDFQIDFEHGKPISWAILDEDLKFLMRLEIKLKFRLAKTFKQIIALQDPKQVAIDEEIKLFSWALQIPSREFVA